MNLKRFFLVLAAILTLSGHLAYAMPDFPIVKKPEPKAWQYETKSWMSTIPDNVKLGELTLVSSHDAGMEDSRQFLTLFVHTQYYDIKKQAEFGVRFFDIRLWNTRNGYRTYHGQESGDYMTDIMDDAVKFLEENPRETVILKFSHWDKMSMIPDVLNKILAETKWTNRLFKDTDNSAPVLNLVPLGKLRGKIILLIDTKDDKNVDAREDKYSKEHGFTPGKGVWRFGELSGKYKGEKGYYRIYDSYANCGDYITMYRDQNQKWKEFVKDFGSSKDAFMLCWQLTNWIIGPYKLACDINPHLAGDLNSLVLENRVKPGLVNLDYIDDNICNCVINLNRSVQGNAVSYLDPYIDGSNVVTFQTKYCDNYKTISGTYSSPVHLETGWYVVEKDAELNDGCIIDGDVHIILKDNTTAKFKGHNDGAGIEVTASNAYLTIYAQSTDPGQMGKLEARGRNGGAGIGGNGQSGENSHGHDIKIHGGNVSAYGDDWAGNGGAGIGGGTAGNGYSITITGGIVNAYGSNNAAGIGGSRIDKHGGTGSDIKIYGGTVNALGGTEGGSGIGGSKNATGKDIYIYGGVVDAHGRGGSAGIGGGYAGSGENINIEGGRVTVHTDHGGAGIGGGSENWGGALGEKITIKGGTIDANDVANHYSIGPGHNVEEKRRAAREVTIEGGSIFAVGDKPEKHNITERKNQVYEITVQECGPTGTKVEISGLGSYGVRDIYSIGGEVKLWLPNGSYNFKTQNHSYSVSVNGSPQKISPLRSASVKVGKSGYASLYSDKNLLVPDGVIVFAYSFNKQTLIPTEIAPGSVLPANQGYIVMADEGTYEFFDYSGKEPGPYTSVLKGVTVDTKVSDLPEVKKSSSASVFVLGKLDKVTTFYQYKGDHIPAGKAYFIIDK